MFRCHLAWYKVPLFEEEIIAWQYGPVVPEVYTEFRAYIISGQLTLNLRHWKLSWSGKPLSLMSSWAKVLEQYNHIFKIDPHNTQANYWVGGYYVHAQSNTVQRQNVLQRLSRFILLIMMVTICWVGQCYFQEEKQRQRQVLNGRC